MELLIICENIGNVVELNVLPEIIFQIENFELIISTQNF